VGDVDVDGDSAAVEETVIPVITSTDGDGGAAKRRRVTCSMESVEDKQEKMDDKHCSSSAGAGHYQQPFHCNNTSLLPLSL